MAEVVECLIEVSKTLRKTLELYTVALLALQRRHDARGTDGDVMMHDLVEPERREIFAHICPADFALVRMRLEMALVRIGQARHLAAVLDSRDSVPDYERLLKRGLECAGDDSVRDIIARNDVEHRGRIDPRDAQ